MSPPSQVTCLQVSHRTIAPHLVMSCSSLKLLFNDMEHSIL